MKYGVYALILAALMAPGFVFGEGADIADIRADFVDEVPPEVPVKVAMSNSDMNRIACGGEVRDVLYSKEKGLSAKIVGSDVFVKFMVTKKGDKLLYTNTPSELYVVCNDVTYSMVVIPDSMPSQTIRLGSGMAKKIEKNRAAFDGLPFEKKVMRIVREVYTGDIPDSYAITKVSRKVDVYRDLNLVLSRIVDIEGEGIRVKEYSVSLKPHIQVLRLTEGQFMRPELGGNIVAASIDPDHMNLRAGEVGRVFVVERRESAPERGAGDGLGDGLVECEGCLDGGEMAEGSGEAKPQTRPVTLPSKEAAGLPQTIGGLPY